jgi:PAS domain S-box-containing protein
MKFVDLPEEIDLYECVAKFLIELIPEGRVFVQSYDEVRNQFIIRSVMGQDFRDSLTQLIGHDPVGMVFPLDLVFSSPFLENPEEMQKGIRRLDLAPRPGDGLFSFYDLAFHQIPVDICEEIVTTLNIEKAYLTFLSWKGQLLGDVGIFLSAEEEPEDIRVLNSFIRQASIAISKRMTEDQLKRSEKRFQDVLSLFPVPTIIIDPEGRVNFINQLFSQVYGYTCDDLNLIQEWLEEALPTVLFPDEGNLQQRDMGNAERRTITIRCKNGEEKTVSIGMANIGEEHLFITVEDITNTS